MAIPLSPGRVLVVGKVERVDDKPISEAETAAIAAVTEALGA
jgi:hypothetical protein